MMPSTASRSGSGSPASRSWWVSRAARSGASAAPRNGDSRWWRQASFGPVTSPFGVSIRVLILSWEYPPIVEGGLARHVRKLAEGLVRNGVEVHVLARGGGRLAAVEDRHAFVRWVDAMNEDMRAAGVAIGEGLSFDLVHSHDWLVAGAARKLARS